MYSEARKLELLEKVIKTNDEAILIKIEGVLNEKESRLKNIRFSDFAGIISEEDGEAIKSAIEESCEKIFPDEWK